MKKVILTAAVLFVTSFINLNAQTTVDLGVKANGNLTNVKLTYLKGTTNKFNPGGSFAFFTKFGLSENFALQSELMLNYTESKVSCHGKDINFKYAGVEIPVYALGQINAGNGKLFIGAGPHIGYGFSMDSKVEKSNCDVSFKDAFELDHWYAGVNTMVGYEFNFGLGIQGGYQMSWDFSSRQKSSGVKTQIINLGVSYKFRLGGRK